MDKSEIIEKINTYLADEFEVEVSSIHADGIVKDVLSLDSLDYVDLVVILESNFNFKVRQEDFVGIKTFSDLYNYLDSKVNE